MNESLTIHGDSQWVCTASAWVMKCFETCWQQEETLPPTLKSFTWDDFREAKNKFDQGVLGLIHMQFPKHFRRTQLIFICTTVWFPLLFYFFQMKTRIKNSAQDFSSTLILVTVSVRLSIGKKKKGLSICSPTHTHTHGVLKGNTYCGSSVLLWLRELPELFSRM